MTITSVPTSAITSPSETDTPAVAASPHRAARPGRIGGIGGLVFVGSVLAENVLRAQYPTNDASAAKVMTFYADHRGLTLALVVLFPIGLAGLAVFVGSLLARVADGDVWRPAIAGLVGAAGIVGNFTILLVADTAIGGYVHRGAADPAVVEGLWVFHNAVFGVLLASIGVALAGFAGASVRHGLLSTRWKTAGMVGAVLLLVAAATTPAIIDAGPTMLLGLLGFLVWVAFVARASVALLRTTEVAAD